MRRGTSSRKTIDKSLYGEKEEEFCTLVTQGVDPILAWRQASGTKCDDEAVGMVVKRLMNRGDIRLSLEMKRRAKEEEVKANKAERIPFGNASNKGKDIKRDSNNIDIGEDEEDNIEWTQRIALTRLKKLLDGCDSAIKLLEDRPQLFEDVRDLIGEVKGLLASNGITVNNTEGVSELMKLMEHIDYIVTDIANFSIKEYNSTILTANNLMREMNSITGVKKSSGPVKTEAFEDRIIKILDKRISRDKTDVMKEIEDYAFSDD